MPTLQTWLTSIVGKIVRYFAPVCAYNVGQADMNLILLLLRSNLTLLVCMEELYLTDTIFSVVLPDNGCYLQAQTQ